MMETRDSCMITIDAVGTRDPHMVFLEICVVASFIGESFRWNTAHFDYVKGPLGGSTISPPHPISIKEGSTCLS